MPELPVKEVRPPELHLPEIKREEIVRALSEIHLPEIDLTRIERPTIDLSGRSFGRIVSGMAAAVQLVPRIRVVPRARRPRWSLAVGGLIVVGVVAGVAAAVLSNTAVRARLSNVATTLRERVASMRPGDAAQLDVGHDDTIAFDAAETARIEAPPFTDATRIDATGYPAGLGSDHEDGSNVPEEAAARD